ncbi:DUF6543 domain-containing protein [Pseudomonas sp. MWU16-30323]|uniref:dermonecrotic toxin domain-containing protein n=1 Tax=Pseudomonas sp. MWU16-30323 TaxID=2878094 RepID=UPI001CFAB8CC|nr:DUF6543 domain-containing protein [Pseudomonas sp. MWU16-30323]
MIVQPHTQYQPDLPPSSDPTRHQPSERQAPQLGGQAPFSGLAVTGTPVLPVVRAILPAAVAEYVFGRPASAQQGFLTQHDALNIKINRLIRQQPTYEQFVQEYQEYVARTPGAVGQIGELYANAVTRFWTSPRPTEKDPSPPQDQLINLHREMLATQAALRVEDGTLSPASKALIDKAFRYPTLADRENAFPNGARPGVYAITVDDNTPNGARLAGAFMITTTDGSRQTQPHWPNGNKNIPANQDNGPVVLYTPGEGFEEFETPAQLQAALMQRIDKGGVPAELLSQSLPLSAENLRKPLRGDDLTLSFAPTSGDVIAEAIPQLLERQKAELNALTHSDTSDMNGQQISEAMNNAANWSSQLDGSNAMLARGERLEDKQQPQWLKNLSHMNEGQYKHLEAREQQSLQTLASLLEDIPSLPDFASQQLKAALRKKYPTANLDPDRIVVTTTRQSRVHTGRPATYVPRTVSRQHSSLTDLALKNPTAWPAAESHQHSEVKFAAKLTDVSGKPVLGADGKPVVLGTEELKALVNELDVGGKYITLLKERMAPDAQTGAPGKLRSAWKANLSDVMQKQAFLGQLNPQAYPKGSSGPEWVRAVLDFPDAATRPQVDGKTVVANTVSHFGQELQGVIAIGNGQDGPLVLYSPDAPDGISFREVANQAALSALFNEPEWRTYARRKTSPLDPNSLGAIVQGGVVDNVGRLARGNELGSNAYLKPIQGNFQDALYKQLTEILIDKADVGSVSSDEVAKESTYNKAMFGIAVAAVFMDLLPIVGKGVSTATRLTKAGLRVIRAPGQSIVHVLNKPNRLAMIYARYGDGSGMAAGSKASPILRPVLNPAPPSRVVVPLTTTPAAHQVPAAGTPVRALPDISAHSVPDSLLSGRTMRGDGTYQVGEQFYVRYTDGTGVSKPYEISPVYKVEGGPVRVIDPQTKKTVAFLQPAGEGEWRLNRLPGGIKSGTLGSKKASQPQAQKGLGRPGSSAPLPTTNKPLVNHPDWQSAVDSGTHNGQPVYIHYTSKEGAEAIARGHSINDLTRGETRAGSKGGVYVNPPGQQFNGENVENLLFLGNERYVGRGDYMVIFSTDQVPQDLGSITAGSPFVELKMNKEIKLTESNLLYLGPNQFPDYFG